MPVITGVGFYSVRGGFGGEPERVVGTVQNLRGPGQVLGTAAGDTLTALGLVLGSFLVFAFLRTLFGRTWLAGALVIASTGAFAFLGTPWSAVLRLALLIAIIISILARVGLLPMVIAVFVARVLGQAPMTTELSVWYASSMWTAIALVRRLQCGASAWPWVDARY